MSDDITEGMQRLRFAPKGSEPRRGIISLEGPSNSGKTFSALLMGTGIVSVLGGRMALLDTELRGNIYEDSFDYDRYIMDPPFAPIEWQKAFRDLDTKYSVIISDNFSDEYEGPGGYNDIVDKSTVSHKVAKHSEAMAQHKKLMSFIRLLKSQHIFLHRASDKVKLYDGEDPKTGQKKTYVENAGWTPHAKKNFEYDMTLRWMLGPNSMGHAKCLKHIKGLMFPEFEQISEDQGRRIAHWIKGETITPTGGQPAVMMLVTIYAASGQKWCTTSIWKEAADAYRECKAAVADDAVALAELRRLNHDGLIVLAEFAGPKARASLQAEIDAGAAHG